MLHFMTLTILLLTLAATIAMRRVEEDIIKNYPKERRDESDLM
jgi:hypothetical protein